MRTRRRLSTVIIAGTGSILLGFAANSAAHPQSLGDVARREAERRREATRSPGRVYTNESLVATDQPTPQQPAPVGSEPTGPEPSAAAATAPGNPPTVLEEDPETHKLNVRTTAPAREKRDEQYWRARAREVRERLAKAAANLAAIQSNLQALERGPQTPATARERSLVAAAVQRLQSEVSYHQQDVAKLLTHAEMNKVPAEWIQ